MEFMLKVEQDTLVVDRSSKEVSTDLILGSQFLVLAKI